MDKTIGAFGWLDLTVGDAPGVRDFYAEVVGWTPEPVDMGEYSDYNMLNADGVPSGGVCHARGMNADIPPAWSAYVNVASLDASIAACQAHGGNVVTGPRDAGDMGRYAIVRDPAGAHLGLFEHTT